MSLFLTSSIVGGISVMFLPTQVTVSLRSQLHAVGHLPASTAELSAKTSKKASAEEKCI